MNSVYDTLMITDSARRRNRDIDWPRLFSVSLVRFDVSGQNEIMGTFSTADPNPDHIAAHWVEQVRSNWHVPAAELDIFEDEPGWRIILCGSIYSGEHRAVVVHPRHRRDEVIGQVLFRTQTAMLTRPKGASWLK